MKLILTVPGLLSLAADTSPWLWKHVPLEPESVLHKISNTVMLVTVPLAIFETMFDMNLYTFLLIFLLKHRPLLFATIAALALLPGITAFVEQKLHPEVAKKQYICLNMVFNIIGAFTAVSMLKFALDGIENLDMLSKFYSEQIILIFIPLCFWIALSYQHEEQQKELTDHSPSLKWKNQVLNILHLANVYFWGLISALIMTCYILYCHIHHVSMKLSPFYLVYFGVVLVFFHIVCGCAGHDYLYLLFQAAVPAILIFCIQWVFWFTIDQKMQGPLFLFIVLNLVLYLLIITFREKSFWNLITVACGAACTAYFYFFPMPPCLEGTYLWLFNLVLLLLYGLIYICMRDRRFIFCRLLLSAVPTVLICAALWMSSLAGDRQTLSHQSIFIAVHSAAYMLIVLLQKKYNDREAEFDLRNFLLNAARTVVGVIRRWFGTSFFEILSDLSKKVQSFLVLGDRFFVVVFVIMVIGYPIFCTLPFSLERVSYHAAENQIRALCEDEERAERLLSEIRSSEWYDDSPMLEKPDIDQTQYLTFLYDHLREELTEQLPDLVGFSSLTYEKITVWYSEYHE